MENEPKNRRAAFLLGRQLLLGGDSELAEAELGKSLQPDDAEATVYYLRVAQAYESAGDRATARQYLESARQRAQTRQDWKLLARIEQTNRRWLELKPGQ